ncbi:hypothetical protein MP638_003165 [Amoeboaphelidium occidentale]|nr:hypothetical protein MP638_003165 [Amoeboaphelidium occidentale]
MSCAAKCLQVVLALFNIAFLAVGIVITITGGAWLALLNSPNNPVYNFAIATTVIGAVVIIAGFFGTIGACCRAKCTLILYTIFLGLLIIAQIAAGSYALAVSNDSAKVEELSKTAWNSLNTTQQAQFQQDFKCCGYSSPLDSPDLRCTVIIDGSGVSVPSCGSKIQNTVKMTLNNAGIYMFVSAAIELVCLIIAIILIVDDDKRKSGYGRAYA